MKSSKIKPPMMSDVDKMEADGAAMLAAATNMRAQAQALAAAALTAKTGKAATKAADTKIPIKTAVKAKADPIAADKLVRLVSTTDSIHITNIDTHDVVQVRI
jgi:hypothetical protein